MSLRDFRPHVAVLKALGVREFARQIRQGYLDAFAFGLNQFRAELSDMMIASRETGAEAEKEVGCTTIS